MKNLSHLSGPISPTSLPTIRLARSNDLDDCIACMRDSGIAREIIADKVLQLIRENRLWVANVEGGGACAILGFNDSACRHSFYLEWLGVKQEFRKQKLASLLIGHAFNTARKMGKKRMVAGIFKKSSTVSAIAASWGGTARLGEFKRTGAGTDGQEFWVTRL
ncbi:MAG TPA: GNAT family N-acetyltransferase [Tepidisphaeraceae bacterium]|nr:GNAT family N-acetyltransferase [Tepidisphaeraceae bacterium]